ncbi:uncharacterized protein [Misgurnus anguillicaudatus]|uniref:uncharacterized protein isoform X1 n=1 Tax=Misgurnus anguillicaudatus TaxID=75329 RepID=UPI003CCF0FDA
MARVVVMLFFSTVIWNCPTTSALQNVTSVTLQSTVSSTVYFTSMSPSFVIPITGLRCEYSWTKRTLVLIWDNPNAMLSEYEVQVNGYSPKIINETMYQIYPLSAEQYDINVTSITGGRRSKPVSIKCETKFKVIVGSVVAVVIVLFILFMLVGHKICIRIRPSKSRSSGELVGQTRPTNQKKDRIYINTCAVNIQENQNPQSDVIDISTLGNQPYQALDVTMRENAPYEICHSSQKVNRASDTSEIYENNQ